MPQDVLTEEFTDQELTELALAASDVPDPDAIPLSEVLESDDFELLPAWYMPAPMRRSRLLNGWQRRIALIVIVAFLMVDAYGLCSTYGPV